MPKAVKSRRIGFFSGTFDPIHKGHIAFALQALEAAELDTVYFMPEAKPRRKDGVTHYSHRVAMLKIALKPYKNLRAFEVPDKQFSVQKTMPRLKARFKGDELLLLIGSDAAMHMSNAKEWPGAVDMLKSFGLIVGLRGGVDEKNVHKELKLIEDIVPELIIIRAKRRVSSRDIRRAVQSGEHHEGLLRGITSYIKHNWLYSVIPKPKNP